MSLPTGVAADPARSRGRLHPEDSSGPRGPRDIFQRDRDRIIHSKAFRRLAGKTQVFIAPDGDHYRVRLTHSLEVAQIGREFGRALGLDEDLTEALCLAHDIGHPPFGHSGEKALDAKMREHGLFFDHNLHALRIVEHFESRYAAFRGLNLTFEVREGIIKHSRDYAASQFPELGEYVLDLRPPLEAQLVDLTDEIAYNTADLDDGVESGFITIEQIDGEVELFHQHFAATAREFPQATAKLRFYETVRRMFNALVSDLIGQTERNIRESAVRSVDEVRRQPRRLAALSAEMERQRAQCKQFLYKNLYYCAELKRDKEEGERVIADMFDHWLSNPSALPQQYHEQIAAGESAARVVCDYIAGMTDSFFRHTYAEMLGPTPPPA